MNEACLKSIALFGGITCDQFRRMCGVFPFLLRLKDKKQRRSVSNSGAAVDRTGLRKLEQAWTCLSLCVHPGCVCRQQKTVTWFITYCISAAVLCSPVTSKSFNPISAPLIYKNLPPRFSAALVQSACWFLCGKAERVPGPGGFCEQLRAAGRKSRGERTLESCCCVVFRCPAEPLVRVAKWAVRIGKAQTACRSACSHRSLGWSASGLLVVAGWEELAASVLGFRYSC